MKLNLKEGSTTLEFIAVAGILGALSFGLFYANAGEVKDTQQDAADKFRDDQAYLQENKGAESILAKDIQLDTTEVHLQVGESKSVHAQLVPDNVWNTGLVWSVYKNPTKVNAITSSDTMTLTITGMEKGISEINVRASDGSPVIKRVRVVVGDPIVFSASEEEVEIESTKQTVLQITASPADYSKEKVQITWSAEAGAELATFERNVNKLTVIPKENHTEGVVKVHASCYDVVYEQTTEFDFYVNMIAVYSITYDLNSGNPVDNPTQYTKKTETFTLNNPTRRGYTFTGWTGSNGITPNTVVRIVKGTVGDMEYKANWRANVYTIAYDGNTGSGTTASSSHTYDQPKVLTKNGFSKTGHLFLGWNTKVDGTGTSYSDEQIVSNLSDRQGATVTLYAQWSAKQTETTFYRNYNASDTTTTKVVYTYGKANQYFTNNGWTRTGYNQLGWSLDRNSKTAEYLTTNGVADSWIDSKYPRVSLYAVWDPIVYSITYDLQGGTNHSSNPSSYTIESNNIVLQEPTKTGYEFLGWTGSNGDTMQKSVTIPKGSIGNKNYRANWRQKVFTVTLNANGGNVSTSSIQATYDLPYGTLPTPTKTGYTFDGWYVNTAKAVKFIDNTAVHSGTGEFLNPYSGYAATPGLIQLNGETVLYSNKPIWAVYTYDANKNFIKYESLNATEHPISSNAKYIRIELKKGDLSLDSHLSDLIISDVPNLNASYSMSLVESNTINNIEQNHTLYARWNTNVYSISYNLNGGSVSGNPTSYTVEDSSITLKNPTRTGYTFTGWTGSNGSTAQTTVTIPTGSTGNKSYTANWQVNTYTYNIKYVSSSGKSLGTSTVSGTYGSSKSVSAPAKTGYGTPAAQTVTFDSTTAKTITFTYSLTNYSISYTLNSGSVSGNPTSYNIESAAITLNNPTRTGHTFAGWSGSNGSASTSVTIPSGSTGNKSYTANWNVNSYTLDVNGWLNGGSYGGLEGWGTFDVYVNGSLVANDVGDFCQGVAYGSSYSITDIKSANGYRYNGVYSGSASGTMGTSTITVYLSFSGLNTLKITYNCNGGSGSTHNASSSGTYNDYWEWGLNNMGWCEKSGCNYCNRSGYTATGYWYNGNYSEWHDKATYVQDMMNRLGASIDHQSQNITVYAGYGRDTTAPNQNGSGTYHGNSGGHKFTFSPGTDNYFSSSKNVRIQTLRDCYNNNCANNYSFKISWGNSASVSSYVTAVSWGDFGSSTTATLTAGFIVGQAEMDTARNTNGIY